MTEVEQPPQNGIDLSAAEDDESSKARPADIEQDMREMERRKRVEAIMGSKLFREELERIVDSARDGAGSATGILQQLSDIVGIPASRVGSVYKASNCMVPINDIRGVESMGYAKGEKILRCKLAATFRLLDLYGWTQGLGAQITARLKVDQEYFLVNPYGLLYHEITASSLNKVDMQGNVVEQGTTNFGVNKSHFVLHSAVHAARPDIRCAIYIGCSPVVAISSLKTGLLPITKDACVLGEITTHPYTGAIGDADERDKLVRNLGPNSKVLLLSNYGALCCGETIEEAFHAACHIVQACETQLKLLPVGLDNLVLIPEESRKLIYEQSRRPPEDLAKKFAAAVATTTAEEDKEATPTKVVGAAPKWRVGGAEFEALMRMLDNAGYRTGYIYRHPLIKSDPPKPKNDVELPPAVSSLGYLLEEEELFRQGIWKKGDLRKGGDRSRWLNSPNVYQKVEVLETGTPDPKKITKWVAEESPTHSTPVRIEDPLQFVPAGTNPREFKRVQQQIKDNRRADKISAGPQSHILEGVTWDEANRIKDATVSSAGDHVVLMGAASKGIIQRGFQHNATVYKAPYAKNPFDNVTDDELNEYKRTVERKKKSIHGEYTDTDFSESEALSSLPTSGAQQQTKQTTTTTAAVTQSEPEDVLEHQIIRIQTQQAPVPSQPEVVLSDATLNFINGERSHTALNRKPPTGRDKQDISRNELFQEFKEQTEATNKEGDNEKEYDRLSLGMQEKFKNSQETLEYSNKENVYYGDQNLIKWRNIAAITPIPMAFIQEMKHDLFFQRQREKLNYEINYENNVGGEVILNDDDESTTMMMTTTTTTTSSAINTSTNTTNTITRSIAEGCNNAAATIHGFIISNNDGDNWNCNCSGVVDGSEVSDGDAAGRSRRHRRRSRCDANSSNDIGNDYVDNEHRDTIHNADNNPIICRSIFHSSRHNYNCLGHGVAVVPATAIDCTHRLHHCHHCHCNAIEPCANSIALRPPAPPPPPYQYHQHCSIASAAAATQATTSAMTIYDSLISTDYTDVRSDVSSSMAEQQIYQKSIFCCTPAICESVFETILHQQQQQQQQQHQQQQQEQESSDDGNNLIMNIPFSVEERVVDGGDGGDGGGGGASSTCSTPRRRKLRATNTTTTTESSSSSIVATSNNRSHSPYRTLSHFGFNSPQREPKPEHKHIPPAPPSAVTSPVIARKYIPLKRCVSYEEIFSSPRFVDLCENCFEKIVRLKPELMQYRTRLRNLADFAAGTQSQKATFYEDCHHSCPHHHPQHQQQHHHQHQHHVVNGGGGVQYDYDDIDESPSWSMETTTETLPPFTTTSQLETVPEVEEIEAADDEYPANERNVITAIDPSALPLPPAKFIEKIMGMNYSEESANANFHPHTPHTVSSNISIEAMVVDDDDGDGNGNDDNYIIEPVVAEDQKETTITTSVEPPLYHTSITEIWDFGNWQDQPNVGDDNEVVTMEDTNTQDDSRATTNYLSATAGELNVDETAAVNATASANSEHSSSSIHLHYVSAKENLLETGNAATCNINENDDGACGGDCDCHSSSLGTTNNQNNNANAAINLMRRGRVTTNNSSDGILEQPQSQQRQRRQRSLMTRDERTRRKLIFQELWEDHITFFDAKEHQTLSDTESAIDETAERQEQQQHPMRAQQLLSSSSSSSLSDKEVFHGRSYIVKQKQQHNLQQDQQQHPQEHKYMNSDSIEDDLLLESDSCHSGHTYNLSRSREQMFFHEQPTSDGTFVINSSALANCDDVDNTITDDNDCNDDVDGIEMREYIVECVDQMQELHSDGNTVPLDDDNTDRNETEMIRNDDTEMKENVVGRGGDKMKRLHDDGNAVIVDDDNEGINGTKMKRIDSVGNIVTSEENNEGNNVRGMKGNETNGSHANEDNVTAVKRNELHCNAADVVTIEENSKYNNATEMKQSHKINKLYANIGNVVTIDGNNTDNAPGMEKLNDGNTVTVEDSNGNGMKRIDEMSKSHANVDNDVTNENKDDFNVTEMQQNGETNNLQNSNDDVADGTEIQEHNLAFKATIEEYELYSQDCCDDNVVEMKDFNTDDDDDDDDDYDDHYDADNVTHHELTFADVVRANNIDDASNVSVNFEEILIADIDNVDNNNAEQVHSNNNSSSSSNNTDDDNNNIVAEDDVATLPSQDDREFNEVELKILQKIELNQLRESEEIFDKIETTIRNKMTPTKLELWIMQQQQLQQQQREQHLTNDVQQQQQLLTQNSQMHFTNNNHDDNAITTSSPSLSPSSSHRQMKLRRSRSLTNDLQQTATLITTPIAQLLREKLNKTTTPPAPHGAIRKPITTRSTPEFLRRNASHTAAAYVCKRNFIQENIRNAALPRKTNNNHNINLKSSRGMNTQAIFCQNPFAADAMTSSTSTLIHSSTPITTRKVDDNSIAIESASTTSVIKKLPPSSSLSQLPSNNSPIYTFQFAHSSPRFWITMSTPRSMKPPTSPSESSSLSRKKLHQIANKSLEKRRKLTAASSLSSFPSITDHKRMHREEIMDKDTEVITQIQMENSVDNAALKDEESSKKTKVDLEIDALGAEIEQLEPRLTTMKRKINDCGEHIAKCSRHMNDCIVLQQDLANTQHELHNNMLLQQYVEEIACQVQTFSISETDD